MEEREFTIPGTEKMTPMQYLREATKTLPTIVMFENLSKSDDFKNFVKWLTMKYSDLLSIVTNIGLSNDIRNEAAIRASELEFLVLEINETLERGREYGDPSSPKGRMLFEAYLQAREYMAGRVE